MRVINGFMLSANRPRITRTIFFVRVRDDDPPSISRRKSGIIKKNEAASDDERAALANDPGVALIIPRYHKNC